MSSKPSKKVKLSEREQKVLDQQSSKKKSEKQKSRDTKAEKKRQDSHKADNQKETDSHQLATAAAVEAAAQQALEEELGEDEDDYNFEQARRKKTRLPEQQRRDCPYLSTIKRQLLDFDFEKLCSISLINTNVYACLTCGRYFQGRSRNTFAYTHCLEEAHHVFINLVTNKIYCLPDNYEVTDTSLNDIKANLKPQFTEQLIDQIDKNPHYCRGINGNEYLPGFVGMNNLKCTDYINVVIHSLSKVHDLRNFFLFFQREGFDVFDTKTIITTRFGELMRKIWNPRNFKGHVSPHELVQGIIAKSNKKFNIGHQADPIDFMVWLLNNIEKEVKDAPAGLFSHNIIDSCFRGLIEIATYKPLVLHVEEDSTTISAAPHRAAKYNLLANVCHEGTHEVGFYKVHLKNKATNKWYEVQDLHITEIMNQLVCVSESYIQIWERAEEGEMHQKTQ